MASALLLIGKLCFAAVAVAIGHKLARALRREDGYGLHLVALAAIAVGGVGLVSIPLGRVLDSTPVALGGDAGMRIGMILLCVFIWRTF